MKPTANASFQLPRILLGLHALLMPAMAASQSAPGWREYNRAATAAIAAGDTAGYQRALRALQQNVGATPRLAARLANAAFVTHDTAAGKSWLERLAAMGVPMDSGLVRTYGRVAGTDALVQLRSTSVAAARTVDSSTIAWSFADPGLLAEDLGYDASHKRFLVTSAHRGGVYAVDEHGGVSRFAPSPAKLWGLLGLAVDSTRHILWVTTAAFPGTTNYSAADSGKSALLAYDLNSARMIATYAPIDPGPHAFGDITLAPDGSVYVGDGFGGGVYVLHSGATALKAVAPRGTFSSPQTPVVSRDGRRLFVPDYTYGIASISLETGRWHWLRHADSLALSGIDGLYRQGDDLIAVQNGLSPNRISRLAVIGDSLVTRTEVLGRGGEISDVNHAHILGNRIYFIARSGWDRVGDDGVMLNNPGSVTPQIRWMPLGPGANDRPRR